MSCIIQWLLVEKINIQLILHLELANSTEIWQFEGQLWPSFQSERSLQTKLWANFPDEKHKELSYRITLTPAAETSI